MNLELPFAGESSALDEYLSEIDRALDALFLEEVDGEVERIRAERAAGKDDDAARAVA